jgi:phytoene dehydrogenase-like protein
MVNRRMGREWDAIVIGAGHNGLVCACYLARAGLEVLVLEANREIGGCTTTSALIDAAPAHLISPCAQDFCLLRMSSVVEDLQLRRFGYREVHVDPAYVAPLPDGSTLAFWRDPVITAGEIARLDRRDARAYVRFLEMQETALAAGIPFILGDPTRPPAVALRAAIRAGARHPRQMAELARMVAGSAAEAIDARFRHPLVRGGLLSLAAVGAPVTHPGSGVNALFPSLVRHAGVARPVGGAQILPDALRRCLQSAGGSVRTGAEVVHIATRRRRAEGVVLADGEALSARHVISAIDPRHTLLSLLAPGQLPGRIARRAEAIPSENGGTAYLTVHLALSGRLDYGRLQARRHDDLDLRRAALLCGSFEDMVAAVRDASAGRMPDPMPFAAVLPTGPDPGQAPEGQDTLYLWAGWAPRRPAEGWPALAGAAGQAMVDQFARYVDGVRELEVGRFVEPWTTLAQRTRVPNGNPYYVDLLLSRNGPLRPALGLGGYTTPVRGLYLTGGGTHPGPSVSGIPGQLAARKLLAGRRRDASARRPARRPGTVEPVSGPEAPIEAVGV